MPGLLSLLQRGRRTHLGSHEQKGERRREGRRGHKHNYFSLSLSPLSLSMAAAIDWESMGTESLAPLRLLHQSQGCSSPHLQDVSRFLPPQKGLCATSAIKMKSFSLSLSLFLFLSPPLLLPAGVGRGRGAITIEDGGGTKDQF